MCVCKDNDGRYADLHLHTNASDGTYGPSELVEAAAKLGFSAIAIADHDTVIGLDEAIERGKTIGLEVIPAVELSTNLDALEIHILGYFIDHHHPGLLEKLLFFRQYRQNRAEFIVVKLQKLGVAVDVDEFLQEYPNESGKSVGRLHVAQHLLSKGAISNIAEAFSRYLGPGKPAYASKCNLSPREACQLIREAGGIPVLAHPQHLRRDELLPELVKAGIKGLEAYYNNTPEVVIDHYRALARELGILVTGGSDCHQDNKDQFLLGTIKLPYRYVEEMKQHLLNTPAG